MVSRAATHPTRRPATLDRHTPAFQTSHSTPTLRRIGTAPAGTTRQPPVSLRRYRHRSRTPASCRSSTRATTPRRAAPAPACGAAGASPTSARPPTRRPAAARTLTAPPPPPDGRSLTRRRRRRPLARRRHPRPPRSVRRRHPRGRPGQSVAATPARPGQSVGGSRPGSPFCSQHTHNGHAHNVML